MALGPLLQVAAVDVVVEHGDRHQGLEVGGADLVDDGLLGLEEALLGPGIVIAHDGLFERDEIVDGLFGLAAGPEGEDLPVAALDRVHGLAARRPPGLSVDGRGDRRVRRVGEGVIGILRPGRAPNTQQGEHCRRGERAGSRV